MEQFITTLIENKEWIPIAISIVTSVVSIVTLFKSIYESRKEQKKYEEAKKPFVCFHLREINGSLILYVSNKGGSAANDLKVDLIEMVNNNGEDCVSSELFNQKFDLYPGETVSDAIGFSGRNVLKDCAASVLLKYSYMYRNKSIRNERRVIQSRGYDLSVYADSSKLALNSLEDPLLSISKASVRMANYLD